MAGLSCGDRALAVVGDRVAVPHDCPVLAWQIALADGARGVDASLPTSAWIPASRFWFFAERHGFLRTAGGGEGAHLARWRDAHRTVRTLAFPRADEPPLYAVIGARPTTFDLAWLPRLAGMTPGYAVSAGASAIGAQIMLRPGVPDAATKGRAVIASSGVHEGFHAIIGPTARDWPAWMNESFANHFALRAAHTFLPAPERVFLEAIFADTGSATSLLAAQRDYGHDPDAARDLFYRRSARFWREIEVVLINRPNFSGRLAALLQENHGFRGIDTNDADALARFLDRYSDDRAGPIVRCYLEGTCTPGIG